MKSRSLILIGIHTSKECFPGTSPFVITTYFPIQGTGSDGLSWIHQEYQGSEPDDTPNFYYYWRNTAADCAPGKHVYFPNCSGNESTVELGKYYPGDDKFYFCAGAGYVENSFTHHIGIDTFAEVCLHEKNHMDNWLAWWPNGYNKDQDADEDYIPDYLEPDLGLKVFPIDEGRCSCDKEICEDFLKKLPGVDPKKYAVDFECIAYKAEKNWKVCSADDEDYSDMSRKIFKKNYSCK